MSKNIQIYNSLTREKEIFTPIQEHKIGMYVCGPTVYNDVHLGNCRTFISFDIIYRYLMHLGYKVRYVRNITDVGHLLDDGEDRMAKGARIEQLEPMEIAHKYTNSFHNILGKFNTLSPSIEPRATGHIIEQIEMVKAILDNGYAYEANGSVYFDTLKFAKATDQYGKLSGRIIEDLMAESRDNLKNQDEKRHPSDFAIWMKASEEHIMKWPSPWSIGFPGWHLECSAMSTKYLGTKFDIHGGGNDLKFPHHENEIAQNIGACNCSPANYWMHTNMLLMNGKKMSKSDGNTISPFELFTGDSVHVSQPYSPMVVKFFMLQTHYRSTLDMSDEALKASEKGFKKLMETNAKLQNLTSNNTTQGSADQEVLDVIEGMYVEMNDDFSTPKTIAKMFEIVPKINSWADGILDINAEVTTTVLQKLQQTFEAFLTDIFGIENEMVSSSGSKTDGLMQLVVELRQIARQNKDWTSSDKIRDSLSALNITLKDGKEATTWTID